MINESEGWAFTSYVNGRNKLCGKKKGTRPWNCFFICTCPGGKHNAVSDGWAWTMTPEGNCRTPPTFCTECPINCFKLKLIRAGDNPMHLFSKWTKTPQTWASDHGNPVAIAMLWLTAQGCDGSRPYDTNAGRKCCAGLLDKTNAPYPEGFELHADHPDVWTENYQPNLAWSDFGRRTQSPNPRIATAALRRFVHYFGRNLEPKLPEKMDLGTMLMVNFLKSQGQERLIEQTVKEYSRLSRDEEKTED